MDSGNDSCLLRSQRYVLAARGRDEEFNALEAREMSSDANLVSMCRHESYIKISLIKSIDHSSKLYHYNSNPNMLLFIYIVSANVHNLSVFTTINQYAIISVIISGINFHYN